MDKEKELEREKAAAEHGHALSEPCEKCSEYYAMPDPVPYLGGSQSFAELKTYRDAQKVEGVYYTATLDYRDLSTNILNDYEMSIEEKAAKLLALTREFQKVVAKAEDYYDLKQLVDGQKPYSGASDPKLPKNVQSMSPKKKAQWVAVFNSTLKKTGNESQAFAAANGVAKKEDDEKVGKRMNKEQASKLSGALDTIKRLLSWATYDEDDEKGLDFDIEFEGKSGFKLLKTEDGYRWISYSSNAFKDLEDELFTTKALEEAVEYADQSGDRGPLRIFHVEGADVGDADFQAVVGRFLVETGTFRDDELGQKAVEYFLENQDKDFQVSIGFQYKLGDENDGVYEWLRIKERSVTPFGDAANPYTSFAFGEVGGKDMDERKLKMMTDIFGEDLASKIVGKAESQTKELEDGGIAFKSSDLLTELKAVADSLPDEAKAKVAAVVEKYSKPEEKKADDKKADKKEDDEEEDMPKKPGMMKKEGETETKSQDLAPVVAALEAIGERLSGLEALKTSVTSLEGEIKTLKEKEATAPRGKTAFFASESKDNVLDPDKIKEVTGDDGKDKLPVNPARSYVEDLIGAPSRS